MPAPFSFQQDIAPYASKYFSAVNSNRFLTGAQQIAMSSSAMDELEKLRETTGKREAEDIATEMGRTRLDRERVALEEARMQLSNLRDATLEAPAAASEFESILGDPVTTDKEKQAGIARLGMKYAKAATHSPELATRFRFAMHAVAPSEGLSAAAQMSQWRWEQDRLNQEQRRVADKEERTAERAESDTRSFIDSAITGATLVPDPIDPTSTKTTFRDPSDRIRLRSIALKLNPEIAAELDKLDDPALLGKVTEMRSGFLAPKTAQDSKKKIGSMFELK